MNTDESLTSKNSNILWPAAYSDDRAPTIPADEYINGNAKKTWDDSEEWATDQ